MRVVRQGVLNQQKKIVDGITDEQIEKIAKATNTTKAEL